MEIKDTMNRRINRMKETRRYPNQPSISAITLSFLGSQIFQYYTIRFTCFVSTYSIKASILY